MNTTTPPARPLLGVDDAEYGVGSALDRRGRHHPVQTLDAFGLSDREAVVNLNTLLRERGLTEYRLDGLSEEVDDKLAENTRWRVVATHIFD